MPSSWPRSGQTSVPSPAAALYSSFRRTGALLHAASELRSSSGDLALTALAVLLSRLARQETISIQVDSAQFEFHIAAETPFRLLLDSLASENQQQAVLDPGPQCQIALPPPGSASPLVIRRPIHGRADANSVRLLVQPAAGEVETISSSGLLLIVGEGGRQLEFRSSSGLWSQETLTQWLSYLIVLLEKAASAPETSTDRLPLWDQADALRFYAAWNRTETTFPGPGTVVGRFLEQAAQTPDATAVVSGEQRYTYRELDQRSTHLAGLLAAAGSGPGRAVAVCMDRSIDLPMALLAVLKSGGFYVPLEPSHPALRLRGIIEECNPAAILTDAIWAGSVTGWLGDLPVPVILADGIAENDGGLHPLPASLDPETLAYTIYTSGTTGKPKGVRIPHRALLNLVCSIAAEPGIRASDCLLGVAPISFDIASMDMFLPISTGATLVIASRTDAADPYRLANLIESQQITVMQATPATWRLLVASGWKGKSDLRMLCGGEAVSRELANSLLALGQELWNCYGPTETTIWSSVLRIYPGRGIVPVGPPMPNTTFYVLDPAGNLLPPGVPGELAIGGIGVSHGYVNRPELNSQRFLPDSFGPVASSRLFRTGDLVRLVEGSAGSYLLEFFGRSDHQVKLRGYRIELGEIESVLRTWDGITDAVAILREDIPGEPRLVAYVLSPEKPVDSNAIIEYAAATLPAYMLPSVVVRMERFPLSTAGKIDRRALPVPESVQPARPISAAVNENPADELETRLLRIFREVLRNDAIGLHDNFFRFGGYSLLTIRLFSRIDRELNARLPISLLFDAPTVRQLAEVIRKGAAPSVIVPIRPEGRSAPIFLIQSYLLYAAMLEMIESDRPVYGVRELGNESEPVSVAKRAEIFAREITSIYPSGPLYLAGWCAAGTLTVEIARQLRESGREVGLVALFDAERPGYAPPRSLAHLGTRLRSRTSFHITRLRDIDWKQRFAYLSDAVARNWEAAVDTYYAVSFRLLRWMHKRFSIQLPASAFHRVYANMSDFETQQVRPYPGTLNLYRAADVPDRGDPDATLGWAAVADDVSVSFVAGDHVSMFKKPHVDSLAQLLKQQMNSYEAASAKS